MHRLKALIMSFPTRYRSFWSVEVLIVSVEIVWVCVDTWRRSCRPRALETRFCLRVPWHRHRVKRTIARWKADEQGFQTVYLWASEMTMAPCGAATLSCIIYNTSIWSPTSSPHRTKPSKPWKLGDTPLKRGDQWLYNGILLSFQLIDGQKWQHFFLRPKID